MLRREGGPVCTVIILNDLPVKLTPEVVGH